MGRRRIRFNKLKNYEIYDEAMTAITDKQVLELSNVFGIPKETLKKLIISSAIMLDCLHNDIIHKMLYGSDKQ